MEVYRKPILHLFILRNCVNLSPLRGRIHGSSCRYPRSHHDRVIVATARIHDAVLLTKDPVITEVKQVKTVW